MVWYEELNSNSVLNLKIKFGHILVVVVVCVVGAKYVDRSLTLSLFLSLSLSLSHVKLFYV